MEELFSDFEEAFIAGFCDAAPDGYDVSSDVNAPAPWCAPWHYEDVKKWFDATLSPYMMGKKWGKRCYIDLEALISEKKTTKKCSTKRRTATKKEPLKYITFTALSEDEKKRVKIGYYDAHGADKTRPCLGSRDAFIWKNFLSGMTFPVPEDLSAEGIGRYIADIQLKKWKEMILEDVDFMMHGPEPDYVYE